MSKIFFVHPGGETQPVEAADGSTVMRAALIGGVDGITADCGGEVSCATCHVFVDEAWHERVGSPGLDEDDMLEFTACTRTPHSRLSCQIQIDDDLDGLVVHLPESQ
jgi:2Fe-2S ferredoxin